MITGAMLRDSIISAANSISNFREAVNILNVFPVPDGDTGTNMGMTMAAAKKAMADVTDDVSAGVVADKAASAMLRGARGNSGVILSLIFRGIADGLKGCHAANGAIIAAALDQGSAKAYKAVQNPMEGTILTVIKSAANAARENSRDDIDATETFEAAYKGAIEALQKTPDMLHILKKAKVVDAGGQGLCYIFLGMLSVFLDGRIVETSEPEDATAAPPVVFDGEVMGEDEIKYAYCTEFIVKKSPDCPHNVDELRGYLTSVADCVVAVDDGEIIKIHAHSNIPGDIITKGLTYGELLTVKIENMKQQHRNAHWGVGDRSEEKAKQTPAVKKAAPEKKYGFVAVCAGSGLEQLFGEIGVDKVVSGGQTMNPSTDDILNAVNAVPAQIVFVLPNNKNIILAAEQAATLADDRKVILIRTTTVPQGIAAALAFDPDASEASNLDAMNAAFARVSTVSVTYAARDSFVGGFNIKKNQCMGMENGKIVAVEDDPNDSAFKAVKRVAKRSAEMITVYYGESITKEKAQALETMLAERYSDAAIMTVYGGQPVYHYLISVE
ncbi:MAG: DAK2 domain-containing protein [Clostridia bacterium]|nr:DAK2 domain-containing protein [Clostridia bacterium]